MRASALLFNIFLAAVINVAYTYSKADKDIMDASGLMRKTMEARGGVQVAVCQSWRSCFGAYFTLTMPESSCNRPKS